MARLRFEVIDHHRPRISLKVKAIEIVVEPKVVIISTEHVHLSSHYCGGVSIASGRLCSRGRKQGPFVGF